MTEEELQAIKARAEASTPGPLAVEKSLNDDLGSVHLAVRTDYLPADTPWSYRYLCWLNGMIAYDPRSDWLSKLQECPACHRFIYQHRLVQFPVELRIDPQLQADAELFAHAREDILKLVDQVEQLRGILDRLLIAGNSIANALLSRGLHPADYETIEQAQACLIVPAGPTNSGNVTAYEEWVCWKEMMNARDALRALLGEED